MMDLNKEVARKYKKALVTGGAGFIGSHICEELVKTGIEVVSLDSYVAGKEENIQDLKKFPNFLGVKADITDFDDLKKHFSGVDIVFHNAASKKTVSLKDPRRDLEVNAKGTFNLLELSRDTGVKRFVHASTGSVYGEPVVFPQDESHPLSPVSTYGVSKLAGERYAILFHKLFGLNTTVLRYFHVFGSRQEFNDFGGVVAIFIRNMMENKPLIIFGDGSQQRSFTYVKDVVRANLLVAVNDGSIGKVYNCASGVKVTVGELAKAVLETFGRDESQIDYKDWTIGDIKNFEVDNTKIKKLGMEFSTDFSVRLKETIKEMKDYITKLKNKNA
ncbi:MAG: SDR family NAD(P)-dependent oxidoreductase [bacterium]|nr:SDR family NAD(P)-dependent oxidoreductase [bacterium]